METFRWYCVQVIVVMGHVVIDIITAFKKLTIFVLLPLIFCYYIFKSKKLC